MQYAKSIIFFVVFRSTWKVSRGFSLCPTTRPPSISSTRPSTLGGTWSTRSPSTSLSTIRPRVELTPSCHKKIGSGFSAPPSISWLKSWSRWFKNFWLGFLPGQSEIIWTYQLFHHLLSFVTGSLLILTISCWKLKIMNKCNPRTEQWQVKFEKCSPLHIVKRQYTDYLSCSYK